MAFTRYFMFPLLAALSANAAYSQEQSTEQKNAETKATSQSPHYQSAFSDYKSFREPEVMSWLAANDQVRHAGGMGAMAGHDMSKMNGGEMPGSEGKSGSGAQSAMPAHDMGSMKDSGSMSEHEMSKMNAKPISGKTTAEASRNPADQKKSTPPHDMAKMGKSKPEKSATGSPKPTMKAAAPEQTMDHSKMKMKD
jgi:hypothetical protein